LSILENSKEMKFLTILGVALFAIGMNAENIEQEDKITGY
jgi:hypothetical protein